MKVSKVQTVKNGPQLSELIQGYWRLNDWKMTTQEQLTFLKQHIELGITTVDHAHVYGNPSCEELFGKSLKLDPSVSHQIEIISKAGIQPHNTSKGEKVPYYDNRGTSILNSVDTSLTRLNVERLDVLLIHRPDSLLNADDIAQSFDTLRSNGKVKSFGVSNFTNTQFQLLQSRLNYPLITNQVELNPFNFEVIEDGTLDFLQEKKVTPMAWSCLAGGKIFNDTSDQGVRLRDCLNQISQELNASPDQIVYAWIRKHPSRPLLIMGSGNINRVKAAVESLSIELTHEQWYRIWSASKGHLIP